jgi:hypothetical protein
MGREEPIPIRRLTVLLQVFSYVCFTAARFPQSVVEMTGLAAPDWS